MNNDLVNPGDGELSRPLRSLSEVTEDEEPLFPIPPDPAPELIYNTKTETRCLLCKSHLRTYLEHLYVASGRSPKAVLDFLALHYNVSYNYDSLTLHMRRHAELDQILTSGLGVIAGQGALFEYWRFRELELAIDTVMLQIDRVQGMNTRRDPDIELRQANTMMNLAKTLASLKSQRDEEATHSIDIFAILVKLRDSLPDERSRKVMHQGIIAVRQEMMNKKKES